MTGRSRPYDAVKRCLDLVSAGAGLIVLAPVIAVTALSVRAKLGSPVIFTQERPGKHGKIFTLYKFRSMLDAEPERGIISDEQRLTPFGRALRATSLDELPSLVNVLRGEMSIVGPRPLLVEYLDRYTPAQARRHEVRPGVTGLAQVSGRNAIEWEEKFRLDVDYVDRRSFALDARIIGRTIAAVFARRGVEKAGFATTDRFGGSAHAG